MKSSKGGQKSHMQTNTTKAKLAEGHVVFGAIISRYAPDLIELFGAIGYDFVMIDCEHGTMDFDHVEHMVRAAEVFGITPIARVPNHEDSTILRYLDRGVQGIIIPHVNTRDTADAVARAARYAPEGHRGIGGGRAHDYNVGVSRAASTRWINDQLLVIPMVEETTAVDNLDAILTVPGVDVLHVASGDLGQSMGNPGPEKVRDLMRQVVPRIRAGGKFVGVGGNSPSDAAGVAEFIKLGANFVTISALGLLRLGAEDFRQRVEAAL
jgi:2-keto-3-deoxy-L-rhamnonate aldolase RhmA